MHDVIKYNSRYTDELKYYFQKTEDEYIINSIKSFGSITLDLGGGTGRLIPYFNNSDYKLLIIDNDCKKISVAQTKAKKMKSVFVLCGDAFTIPLKDKSINNYLLKVYDPKIDRAILISAFLVNYLYFHN